MIIKDWRYYNHVAVPSTAPHEIPDLSSIEDGSIWNLDGKKPIMARWTTDWDSGWNTEWWYVIKDTPFDLSSLNTKRRYEITKAKRFFDISEIDPADYRDALYQIQIDAFSAYPQKYRPVVEKKEFFKTIESWSQKVKNGDINVLGAFFKETQELVGYSLVFNQKLYLDFCILKTKPVYEKKNVNAALVNGILSFFERDIINGKYVCDGSRSVYHETHFQDYLEKYFGFRKVYCKLNVAYPFYVKLIVKFLYPFRKLISCFGKVNGKMHILASVLKMEEIACIGRRRYSA